VLVKPDCDKVIPLFPEFIQPQDGSEKQDCELLVLSLPKQMPPSAG